ncbi:RTX toxin [Colletotrichum tofieldiae]|nr:RTX toxin [Colletotrichum tofieldiae]GKT91410.1 RTX toxin [Colletotrichum tofieldiae]
MSVNAGSRLPESSVARRLVKALKHRFLQLLGRLGRTIVGLAFRVLVGNLLRHSPRLRLANLAIDAQTCGNHASNIANVSGHDNRRALLGQLGKRVDVLLGDGQADSTLSRLFAIGDALGNGVDASRRGLGLHENGLGLTGCSVDLLGAHGFGSENDTLLLTLGDIDGRLSLTLGVQNLCSLRALSGDLAVHGLNNSGGSVDISDLVTQAGNTPGLRGLVDGGGNVRVESCALLENMVEGQLTDLGSHRGLRQLGDGVFGIFDSVAGKMSRMTVLAGSDGFWK